MGAALLVFASFLPWAKATGSLFYVTKDGVDADGAITLLLAVVIGLVAALTLLRPPPSRVGALIVLVGGVVGVGVYQGMEFILQHGMRDTLGKLGVAASRAACCAAALRRARVWSFTVGRDEERNWEALRALIG